MNDLEASSLGPKVWESPSPPAARCNARLDAKPPFDVFSLLAEPLGQLAQEVDDCSCRYPEEEEGGGEGLKEELLEKYP